MFSCSVNLCTSPFHPLFLSFLLSMLHGPSSHPHTHSPTSPQFIPLQSHGLMSSRTTLSSSAQPLNSILCIYLPPSPPPILRAPLYTSPSYIYSRPQGFVFSPRTPSSFLHFPRALNPLQSPRDPRPQIFLPPGSSTHTRYFTTRFSVLVTWSAPESVTRMD